MQTHLPIMFKSTINLLHEYFFTNYLLYLRLTQAVIGAEMNTFVPLPKLFMCVQLFCKFSNFCVLNFVSKY